MNTKLLIAGIALTLLAFRYESRKDAAPTHPTDASRVDNSITHAFDTVLADAIRIGITNTTETLELFEPAIQAARGEQGQRARTLADKVKKENERAKLQLSKGNTTLALDYSVQASTHEDELKKVLFERR